MLLAFGIVLTAAGLLCLRRYQKIVRATVLDEIKAAKLEGRSAREAVMNQTIEGIAGAHAWLIAAALLVFVGLGLIVYWMNPTPLP